MTLSKNWLNIKEPIIGLAPMDGITNYPYRYVVSKYGNPDVMFTEFVNVNSLIKGNSVVYDDLEYDNDQRPIVAQLFGYEPKYFYKAAIIICLLGFDGIDINMGCPAKKIVNNKSGASLIKNKPLAKNIIKSVHNGIRDYMTGINLDDIAELNEKLKHTIMKNKNYKPNDRTKIPVSVKTRVGIDEPALEEWFSFLDNQNLDAIIIHARTLRQMYSGKADWGLIKKTVDMCNTTIIGNGDIKDLKDAKEKIEYSGAKGVLIGRASLGNPWIFKNKENLKQDKEIIIYKPDKHELYKTIMDHLYKLKEFKPDKFYEIKKYLCWYTKGMDNAKSIREDLMKTNNFEEIENKLKNIFN